MEGKNFWVLKPGATLTEQAGRIGLQLGGKLHYAESAGQAALLRALSHGPQPLGTVSVLLRTRDETLGEDTATVLETMKFVLDFGDYFDALGADMLMVQHE